VLSVGGTARRLSVDHTADEKEEVQRVEVKPFIFTLYIIPFNLNSKIHCNPLHHNTADANGEVQHVEVIHNTICIHSKFKLQCSSQFAFTSLISCNTYPSILNESHTLIRDWEAILILACLLTRTVMGW
jgi:hypothetical protein